MSFDRVRYSCADDAVLRLVDTTGNGPSVAQAATLLTHRRGREVGVRAGTVPIALDRLRIQAGDDAVLLGEASQQVAGEPQAESADHQRQQ